VQQSPSEGEEGHTTNHANGTGPFRMESRRPDALKVPEANAGWWDTPQHNLTRIEHSPVGSGTDRFSSSTRGLEQPVGVTVPYSPPGHLGLRVWPTRWPSRRRRRGASAGC
jgi:ABC-type transport system substrate-binding protein